MSATITKPSFRARAIATGVVIRCPLLRDNRTSQSHVESVENDP
jgi:hypothetical protein